MGMAFSFPVVGYDAMIGGLKVLPSLGDIVRSILRSISCNGGDSEPAASAHGKLLIQGSISLSGGEMHSSLEPDKYKDPHDSKSRRFGHLKKRSLESILPDFPEHEAAVKLQKVYKSFRTRRQLADCAVLVEQRWWKLLDFALLRRSSVSFFDIERQESAVSRWSRAKSRAAKVGKGLSKDDKAQKLALQHWLEAIDPRHRYGHNLQFYYDRWLQCESMQPFFYWLDVGEGKEVNLEQQCARSKLQQQCIKYLGPRERKTYEVIIEEGKFMYRQSREVLDTRDGLKSGKWIFVLSTLKKLYVGQKKKGTFQHSSFLAGGATSAAGQLVVENGVLTAVWPHSGHYRPTQKNFEEFMTFLQDNNVDITYVKKNPTEDGEDCSGLRNSKSELNLTELNASVNLSFWKPSKFDAFGLLNTSPSQADPDLGAEEKLEESLNGESEEVVDESKASATEPNRISSDEENETLSNSSHTNKLYMRGGEENAIPSEMILRRINSKRKIQSYQLGRKLSCRWTTGAGPRIGCVRDYPSELQFRALEQVNLSPTSLRMPSFNAPRLAKCHSPITDAAF